MLPTRIPARVEQKMQEFIRFWSQRVGGNWEEGPRYEVAERFERQVEALVRTALSRGRR